LEGVFVKIKTPFGSLQLSDSGSLHFSWRVERLLSGGSGDALPYERNITTQFSHHLLFSFKRR
jgi:hypothetical protein